MSSKRRSRSGRVGVHSHSKKCPWPLFHSHTQALRGLGVQTPYAALILTDEVIRLLVLQRRHNLCHLQTPYRRTSGS